MSGPELDPRLREMFGVLRREEEQAGPSFDRLRAAAARRQHRAGERGHGGRSPVVRIAAITASAAAALIAVTWLVVDAPLGGKPRGAPASPPFSAGPAPTISTWQPATDFLLRTPGRELLTISPAFRPLPSIGLEAPPRGPRFPRSQPPAARRTST
ncbi:MAG TPA: hypothetical protein VHR45_07260 [Thermoanaerobaculia bacterium]|nr:hypothetical protein [Thermoanaerobaculia bacterium]